MARLYVLSGDLLGATFDLDSDAVLGRGDEADVTIPEPSVSRRHARLAPLTLGRWRLQDLGSSNGTFVDDERIKEAELGDGAMFRIGAIELRLRTVLDDEPDLEFDEPDFEFDEPDFEFDEGDDGEGELELEYGDDLDEALSTAPGPAGRPAPRPTPRPTPRPARVEPPRAPSASGPSAGSPSKGPQPARPAAPGAGAAADRERAARRAAALGSGARRAGQPGGPRVTESGRPILQYAQTRSGGTEVAQVGGIGRAVVVLAAIAVLAGAAYGAFVLMQSLQ